MKRIVMFAAAGAAVAASTGAAAQSSDPYRSAGLHGQSFSHSEYKDPIVVLRKFAECNISYHRNAALRYIVLPLGTAPTENDAHEIFDSHCLDFVSGRLKMGQLAYQGALAEELIRREHSHPGADFADLPPLDWSVPDPQYSTYNVALAGRVVGTLGECVVRANPAGALALLKTGNQAAESNAFQAITPHIAGCLDKGQSMTLNRANLRSGIAVSYYRLASSAKQQQAAR
jgi:hypothetical protein